MEFLFDPTANPMVAWPMHVFDCCPINDGASCMLLVAEEIAGQFTDVPLNVASIGQGNGRFRTRICVSALPTTWAARAEHAR